MKKTSAKKQPAKNARVAVRPVASKPTVKNVATKSCMSSCSMSVYIYWFIILFFVAAASFVCGGELKGRRIAKNNTPVVEQVAITEETLLKVGDFINSAREHLQSGNNENAIIDLTAAIDTGAAPVDVYLVRGRTYIQMGDFRNAMADFDSAIQREPSNADAYYERALLNTKIEDYNAAINDINNALASNVSNPSSLLSMRDLYAKRGQLNLWLKNYNGAVADYTNSLSHNSGTVNPTVYADRAEAYTALEMFENAIDDYESAIRVISEQIQGAPTMDEREQLSSNAMLYFERSAALNWKIGHIDAARSDLESAYTIAVALNDDASVSKYQALIADMNAPVPAPDAATAPAPVVEPAPADVVPSEPVVENQ